MLCFWNEKTHTQLAGPSTYFSDAFVLVDVTLQVAVSHVFKLCKPKRHSCHLLTCAGFEVVQQLQTER